jgi:hypothetical protein
MPYQADAGPPRFRYTPTAGRPPSVPLSAWPRDEQDEPVIPGFEFDGRAQRIQAVGPASPDRFSPDRFDSDRFDPDRFDQDRFDPDRFDSDRFSPDLFSADRFDSDRFESDRWPPPARAIPARPVPARSEWVPLLRSSSPEPAKRSWFRQFLSALEFRGLAVRVAIPILAMTVFGVSVVVIAGADGSHTGPAPAPTSLGFPPATLAGSQFTAADNARGISQTLGRVTSDGAEIVAVGSQAGARLARAQFFVSLDDGRSWAMGSVRTPDGGPPPPGYAARFVAGGQGAWVAIGPGSIWTSTGGRTWTLSSTTGLPLLPGDQVSVLRRTAAGFIAVGANVPGGDQARASPVVFLSANGINWRRLGAGQLHLAAGTSRVLDIRYAAARGNQVLIAGDVAEVTRRSGRAVTVRTSAAWLSSDGGTTWTLAVPPAVALAGHGARAEISGEAVTADGFILVRPATAGTRPAVDVYRSPNGTAWTFAATLGTPVGFTAGMANGGPDGAVVVGQAGPALTAFTSPDGATWQRAPVFGSAAAESVSGVTMAGDGAVVAAGTSTDDPDSRQPLITVLGPQGLPDQVGIAKIPGATDRQLAVNAVAAANGRQVAVGSANGFPAAWSSANGGDSWTRGVGQPSEALDRPGVQQLTSVTYGAAGWLAVGGVTVPPPIPAPSSPPIPPGGTAEHPVVVGSANGSSWQAADGEAAFAGPGLFTEQAAAGPGGYVIVGYQTVPGRTIAAAWWSAGLTGWHRAGDAAPGALDGGASRQMLAVTASPHGFVAVGSVGNQASAWTSPDGRDWTQVNLPVPVGATRTVLQHVASNGRTVAAVGTALTTAGQQLPFAASSSDGGAVWTESALPVPSGRASVTALAAAGGGFIATGTFGLTPGQQDVVVWTSADGSAWTAITPAGQGLAGPGVQAITGLAASGRTLTGVGFTASPAGEQPTFWQSPIR